MTVLSQVSVRMAVEQRMQDWESKLPDTGQEEAIPGNCTSNAASAAAALAAALSMPFVVRWEVDLESGGMASLSADISPGTTLEWPPSKLMLRVTDPSKGTPEATDEIQVPSEMSVAQLAVVIAGSSLGNRALEQAPVLPQPSAIADTAAATAAADGVAVVEGGTSILVDTDPSRGIFQPRSLTQWHHDVCGHHALFNVRHLLQSVSAIGTIEESESGLSVLQNEVFFWGTVFADVRFLADHGESTGRWPRSRITCGILDEIHMIQVIATDEFLKDRASVVSCPEILVRESAAGQALLAVVNGTQVAHGFLLGCHVHWIGLVVVKTAAGPQVWYCDSYNRPRAGLLTEEQVKECVMQQDEAHTETLRKCLQARPDFKHRPIDQVEAAVEGGVPEWWKGTQKSALFWRVRPRNVRRTLREQENQNLRQYLEIFSSAFEKWVD